MPSEYEQLKARLAEITDLSKVSSVLGWDRQTKMPPAGAPARIRQMATLARLIHERYTDPEMLNLLEGLDEWSKTLDYDSDEAGLIRLTRRDVTRRRAVPTDLVAEISKAAGEGYQAWKQARENDDFEMFRPYLERMLDLKRREAACYPAGEHIYDALLYDFEPGIPTTEVARVFDAVKGPQIALIQAIQASPVTLDNSLLHQHFDHDTQLKAALEVAQILGYSLERGRLDLTTHPFATSFSVNDARITTRVYEDFFNPCYFGTLHETGHAMYELGVAQRFEGLPLARGAWSTMHESQSRLHENLIGRSWAFVQHVFPILQRHFPQQFGRATAEDFYRAINAVQPSLIRVEADEVTYNLHIILRFELEIALLDGSLAVRDLPDAWNAKMQHYLGQTPPNNAQGVLQDVHWSSGLLGYFPTYALGNIVGGQLWAALLRDVPNRDELLAEGNLAPIRAWLVENVHQHGKKYTAPELLQRITGSAQIDPQPYITYLQTKFGELYQL